MSPTPQPHLPPLSPVSPLSPSRPESSAPRSQHQYPAQPEDQPVVSPLAADWPDSPTLGYLSPVSIISPHPSEQLHFNRTPAAAPPPLRDVAAPLPPPKAHLSAAPTVPRTNPLARSGTEHLQDHTPPSFNKPTITSTRCPPRKPLASAHQSRLIVGDEKEEEEEGRSSRPTTMYLVDHSPYRAAPAPTTPIARPHYVNGVSYHGGRSFDAVDRVGFEDVDMEMEMRESTTYGDRDARSSRVGGSMSGDEGGRGFAQTMQDEKGNAFAWGTTNVGTLDIAVIVSDDGRELEEGARSAYTTLDEPRQRIKSTLRVPVNSWWTPSGAQVVKAEAETANLDPLSACGRIECYQCVRWAPDATTSCHNEFGIDLNEDISDVFYPQYVRVDFLEKCQMSPLL